jgi:hypothetical protein
MSEPQKKLPVGCACTVTYCDVGENGPGMEKLGRPTDRPVSVSDLNTMQKTYESSLQGYAELYDLKEAMKSRNTSGCELRESVVLVLRGFADRALGMGTLACMESELQSMEEEGLLDSRALMRGAVKKKTPGTIM